MLRCSKSLKCAAGSNRTVFCMEKEVLLGGANWIYQNQNTRKIPVHIPESNALGNQVSEAKN